MGLKDKIEAERQKLIERCERGLAGEEKTDVTTMNMWLTNQCNIHCIMCPFISKDYPNKTYYNEKPHMVTLKEVKKILPRKRFVWKKDIAINKKIAFNFFKGETLLNPETMAICKYIKNLYPNSEISILSNGTIPPKNPEIVRYIDVLGFSLDGGTQEVFEMIRTPSRFEHVKRTITEWVRARNEFNPKLLLRTSTTLSTLNFEDLPNIVRTVGEIVKAEGGGWDSIYCQPIVIEEYQDKELNRITLEHVDKELGHKILNETKRIASEYQIRLDIPQIIYNMFDVEDNVYEIGEERYKNIQSNLPEEVFCKKLENGTLSYALDGKIGFACCFMDKKYWRELIERYNIPDNKTPDEIYNSVGYWKLRKDLLEGKLQKECRNCTIGKSDYYTLCEQLQKECN